MLTLLLTVGTLTVLFAAVYLAGRLARARTPEHVHCDVRAGDYELVVDRRLSASWDAGSAADVIRCSAFTDRVECQKTCLALLKRPRATA